MIMVHWIVFVTFVISVVSLGASLLTFFKQKRKYKEILREIDNRITFLKMDLKKLREDENRYFSKVFELEMNLENYRKAAWIIGEKVEKVEEELKELKKYPDEYESRYRDVVRKVLELDNDFSEKFETLGKVILKLKKRK